MFFHIIIIVIVIVIVIIIIKIESAVQGRERVRTLYQSEDPKPHNKKPWKQAKDKIVYTKRAD